VYQNQNEIVRRVHAGGRPNLKEINWSQIFDRYILVPPSVQRRRTNLQSLIQNKKARAAHVASPQLSPVIASSIVVFLRIQARPFYAAGDGDGLSGLGPEPDERARLRILRLRFSASSRLFFFFTEGFS